MRQALKIVIASVFFTFFSSHCSAECELISPQKQTLQQPITLTDGLHDLQFFCRLTEPRILNFPLDVVIDSSIYSQSDTKITSLTSARSAYFLPDGSYQFTLSLTALRSTELSVNVQRVEDFQQQNGLHILTMASFAGFCLALCIYVGILGRSMRNAGFYAYSSYILCAGMFFVLQEGLLGVLFPQLPWLHLLSLKLIFAGLTVYTAQRFISRLLEFRLILKKWESTALHYAGLLILGLALVAALAPPALSTIASTVMGTVTIIAMLGISVATVYARYRKIHGAGWVLLALVILLGAMIFRVYLRDVSEFLHRYALIIAVTLEALLLAVAASERVKKLQKDKMEAFISAASDPLCPVLNRRGWEEAARKMLTSHTKNGGFLVLMFIDLDDFKTVNDTYGHQIGDRALVILSKILNNQGRSQDIVGRLGGDEFVFMSHCFNRKVAERMVQRVCARLEGLNLKIDDLQIPISASVGAQVIDAPHADLSILLHQADMLMYEQKTAESTV